MHLGVYLDWFSELLSVKSIKVETLKSSLTGAGQSRDRSYKSRSFSGILIKEVLYQTYLGVYLDGFSEVLGVKSKKVSKIPSHH